MTRAERNQIELDQAIEQIDSVEEVSAFLCAAANVLYAKANREPLRRFLDLAGAALLTHDIARIAEVEYEIDKAIEETTDGSYLCTLSWLLVAQRTLIAKKDVRPALVNIAQFLREVGEDNHLFDALAAVHADRS